MPKSDWEYGARQDDENTIGSYDAIDHSGGLFQSPNPPARSTDHGASADTWPGIRHTHESTDSSPHGPLVRPYTRTGGRTRANYDLALETLVVTSDKGKAISAAALVEHRTICDICRETRSVAEIAAHLRSPLGVARVLIGDLADMGMVFIHQNDMVIDDYPTVEFMERVLSGLRRL